MGQMVSIQNTTGHMKILAYRKIIKPESEHNGMVVSAITELSETRVPAKRLGEIVLPGGEKGSKMMNGKAEIDSDVLENLRANDKVVKSWIDSGELIVPPSPAKAQKAA